MTYNRLIAWLSSGFQNQKAVTVFCKAVLILTLLRILFLWNASLVMVKYHHLSTPRSWSGKIMLAPSVLAGDHLSLVYIFFITLLIIGVFIRWNYLSGAIFFWITLNLYRITMPLTNGADQVQLALAVCMIFMVSTPYFKSPKMMAWQTVVFNASVLATQLIIVFVYFISGWDKLMTASWRTGDAFLMISNLQHLINPFFKDLLTNSIINIALAWITILFELTFVVFVWFRSTRIFTLIAGVLFHVTIAIVLNLPEFALMMSVSYLVFLKDTDYVFIKNRLPESSKS